MSRSTHPCHRSVHLNLNDLSLNDLSLLLYPHADGSPECLRQGLGLGHLHIPDQTGTSAFVSSVVIPAASAHLQAVNLTRSERDERHILAQSLCHAHGDGSLSRRRWSGHQDGSTGDLALLHHPQDDPSSSSSGTLTDHTLRGHSRFEVVVQTEPVNVRVGTCDEIISLWMFLHPSTDNTDRSSPFW